MPETTNSKVEAKLQELREKRRENVGRAIAASEAQPSVPSLGDQAGQPNRREKLLKFLAERRNGDGVGAGGLGGGLGQGNGKGAKGELLRRLIQDRQRGPAGNTEAQGNGSSAAAIERLQQLQERLDTRVERIERVLEKIDARMNSSEVKIKPRKTKK
jgi:hypothetical protein